MRERIDWNGALKKPTLFMVLLIVVSCMFYTIDARNSTVIKFSGISK